MGGSKGRVVVAITWLYDVVDLFYTTGVLFVVSLNTKQAMWLSIKSKSRYVFSYSTLSIHAVNRQL